MSTSMQWFTCIDLKTLITTLTDKTMFTKLWSKVIQFTNRHTVFFPYEEWYAGSWCTQNMALNILQWWNFTTLSANAYCTIITTLYTCCHNSKTTTDNWHNTYSNQMVIHTTLSCYWAQYSFMMFLITQCTTEIKTQ